MCMYSAGVCEQPSVDWPWREVKESERSEEIPNEGILSIFALLFIFNTFLLYRYRHIRRHLYYAIYNSCELRTCPLSLLGCVFSLSSFLSPSLSLLHLFLFFFPSLLCRLEGIQRNWEAYLERKRNKRLEELKRERAATAAAAAAAAQEEEAKGTKKSTETERAKSEETGGGRGEEDDGQKEEEEKNKTEEQEEEELPPAKRQKKIEVKTEEKTEEEDVIMTENDDVEETPHTSMLLPDVSMLLEGLDADDDDPKKDQPSMDLACSAERNIAKIEKTAKKFSADTPLTVEEKQKVYKVLTR